MLYEDFRIYRKMLFVVPITGQTDRTGKGGGSDDDAYQK
jgi:hypothetical protein